jgi:hypothetical protein
MTLKVMKEWAERHGITIGDSDLKAAFDDARTLVDERAGEAMSNNAHAEKAAHAFNDLNMLYAIKALCENSLFRTAAGDDAAARISAICNRAAQKQLEAYDKHQGAIKP